MSDITTVGVEKHHSNLASLASFFTENPDWMIYIQNPVNKQEIIKTHRRINLNLNGRECDEDNKQVESIYNQKVLLYRS